MRPVQLARIAAASFAMAFGASGKTKGSFVACIVFMSTKGAGSFVMSFASRMRDFSRTSVLSFEISSLSDSSAGFSQTDLMWPMNSIEI